MNLVSQVDEGGRVWSRPLGTKAVRRIERRKPRQSGSANLVAQVDAGASRVSVAENRGNQGSQQQRQSAAATVRSVSSSDSQVSQPGRSQSGRSQAAQVDAGGRVGSLSPKTGAVRSENVVSGSPGLHHRVRTTQAYVYKPRTSDATVEIVVTSLVNLANSLFSRKLS